MTINVSLSVDSTIHPLAEKIVEYKYLIPLGLCGVGIVDARTYEVSRTFEMFFWHHVTIL